MATIFKPMDVQVDGNGVSMAGAKLYFYQTGTNTPQDTFSQSDLAPGHENTNPVVADSNGLWPAIYLGATDYKAILTTADDVTLQTLDPVLVNPAAATLSDEIDAAFGTTQYTLLQRGASAWGGITTKALLDNKFNTTQGTILYRGASDWAALAPPAGASYLTHAGTGNNPAWTARVYAYVTVSGGVPTIAKSSGFTSIVHDATGLFTCTMSNAMPDTNYRITGSVASTSGTTLNNYWGEDQSTARTTTVFHLYFNGDSAGAKDPVAFSLEVFA